LGARTSPFELNPLNFWEEGRSDIAKTVASRIDGLGYREVNTRRILALWSAPRTVSTAFDKMMRTRGDHLVRTEPFSVAYYFGPEQQSRRFVVSHRDTTFTQVLEELREQCKQGPVFIKEMAYQLGPMLRPDVLRDFHGSFLIRDPARALPSLAEQWPDFTDQEAGYIAQHELWTMLREAGQDPAVIDSDDLRRDPEAVVGAWCDAVGIPRRPDALDWEPSMPQEWRIWEQWMTNAATSTGFGPPDPRPPPTVDAAMQQRIARCRPIYDELHAHRLA
jgi:hypothetical protein